MRATHAPASGERVRGVGRPPGRGRGARGAGLGFGDAVNREGSFFVDAGESGSVEGVGGTLSGGQERESGPTHRRGENAGSQGARASRGQNEATVWTIVISS